MSNPVTIEPMSALPKVSGTPVSPCQPQELMLNVQHDPRGMICAGYRCAVLRVLWGDTRVRARWSTPKGEPDPALLGAISTFKFNFGSRIDERRIQKILRLATALKRKTTRSVLNSAAVQEMLREDFGGFPGL